MERNKKWLSYILKQHEGKNFVQRIIDKDSFPVLNNDDGSYSTHKMSWSQIGNKNGLGDNRSGMYFVYPNIIYDKEKKSLVELPPQDAVRYAIQSGEYIAFDNAEDAEWFSKNYKQAWE